MVGLGGATGYEEVQNKTKNDIINLGVGEGDTLMMGRWKNRKVKVKKIGKDEHGIPTINKRKAVTFRYAPKEKVAYDRGLLFKMSREDIHRNNAQNQRYRREGEAVLRSIQEGNHGE